MFCLKHKVLLGSSKLTITVLSFSYKDAIYIIPINPPDHFPFALHSTPKDNFHENLSEHDASRVGMAVTSIWQTRWSISKSLCVSFTREKLL